MFQSPARGPILGLIGLLVVEVVVVAARAAGLLPATGAVKLGLFALIVAPASWLIWQYWVRIDEAAREAQKTAWFWGGTIGGALGWVSLNFIDSPLLPFADRLAQSSPNDLVQVGALAVIVSQLIGMTVVWAGWWWSRR